MSDINAKLTFVTGMHCDAALVEIESSSKDMVSDDIYDCGVYDWIAYNLEIEIPKNSTLIINVDVIPSYWGDSIDEINYAIVGEVDIKPINNHDRMVEEIAELKGALKINKKAFLNLIELDLVPDSAKQETLELADSIHRLLAKLNQEGEE